MNNGDQSAYPYPVQDNELKKGMLKSGMQLHGLTKREAFALAAMQGILAGRNSDVERRDYPETEVARWARQQADELLKALES